MYHWRNVDLKLFSRNVSESLHKKGDLTATSFGVKITTDTINLNSCMTKHIFPNKLNICYCIYLKRTKINGLDMPDAIMVN